MKLLGRVSSSVLDTPAVLRAPTIPYRTGKPYWARGAGPIELPIQVVGALRYRSSARASRCSAPAEHGCSLARWSACHSSTWSCTESDFLEACDVPQPLLAVQSDLRVPLARKLKTLTAVLETLRSHGYTAVRLDEVARTFAGNGGQ